MKKTVKFMLLPLLVLTMITTTFARENPSIVVNDRKLPIVAFNREDRVLAPLRAIFESLNATVHYDNFTKTITAKQDGKIITLTIGNKIASVNGEKATLDVPAQIINDRTVVPIRFIGEALGASVLWIDRTVIINSHKDIIPHFNEKEIDKAIKLVESEFDFPAATLTKVWYDEEKSNKMAESYLESGRGSVNGANFENVIVLLSNFDVDESGDNPVLNPGSTYTDYNWILIRDGKASDWKIDDRGY